MSEPAQWHAATLVADSCWQREWTATEIDALLGWVDQVGPANIVAYPNHLAEFTWSGQQLTCMYQRQYIESASRFADAPTIDAEYRQALDLFDELLNDPRFYVQMTFEPGDMQFVHNHSLLHDRTRFVDHLDPAARRHLLRLWMSLPGDRELDPVFAQRYGSTTVGDRGGISVGNAVPIISLEP